MPHLLIALFTFLLTTQTTEAPRVFLLDGKVLRHERELAQSHPNQADEVLRKARADADKAMSAGPFSVMQKNATPPSGDKHDYMSLAPYFWPNPHTPNHLPYVRRDGERNPEIKEISDHEQMSAMCSAARTLALGYYLSRDPKYAVRAALMLRTWFLNPATKMNPNLEFAQGIRGVNTGRGIGVLESHCLTEVVDAVGLLQGSTDWSSTDDDGLHQWFANYLHWMQTSEHGKDESHSKNNHGSYYDAQVMDFALFLGKTTIAKDVAEDTGEKRIALQVEPDGEQPLELARTKSFSYSVFNLRALVELATLSDQVGMDLWHFQTKDGRSIRGALDFLIPYGMGEKQWPYQQIEPLKPSDMAVPLLRAAAAYHNRMYEEDAKQLIAGKPSIDELLLEEADLTEH